MANITGDSAVTTLGVVHNYILSGSDIDTDKPIVWSGDNCFDLRVGEYVKKFVNGVDASNGYFFDHKEYTGVDNDRKPVIDPKKASMIVDEDLHTEPGAFRIYASYTNSTTGAGSAAKLEGQVGITVPQATPDPTFSRHSITPTYVTHDYDDPSIDAIEVKFRTTYPVGDRAYEHKIHFSGSSQHFWDDGDDIASDDVITPTNGLISRSLNVTHYRPHGRYTGYTTVSATGQVFIPASDTEAAKLVAADGYHIFIEFDEGAVSSLGYLLANEEKFFVDKDCRKIIVTLPN